MYSHHSVMKYILQFIVLLFVSAPFVAAQQKTSLPVPAFDKALQEKHVQLLDVRTPEEFKSGYIAGAVNADWQNRDLFAQQAGKLDKTAPVYVYCLSGIRSGRAADWLSANGFTKVFSLEGGVKAWKDADKKLVK